jgi:hypothetical protein
VRSRRSLTSRTSPASSSRPTSTRSFSDYGGPFARRTSRHGDRRYARTSRGAARACRLHP